MGEFKEGDEAEIFVEHPNLRFATTPEKRAEWSGWHKATWTDFNGGGWVWYGLLGTVTKVRRLTSPDSEGR